MPLLCKPTSPTLTQCFPCPKAPRKQATGHHPLESCPLASLELLTLPSFALQEPGEGWCFPLAPSRLWVGQGLPAWPSREAFFQGHWSLHTGTATPSNKTWAQNNFVQNFAESGWDI